MMISYERWTMYWKHVVSIRWTITLLDLDLALVKFSFSKIWRHENLIFWQKCKTFVGLFTTLWTSTSSGSHYLSQSLKLLGANGDSMYYKYSRWNRTKPVDIKKLNNWSTFWISLLTTLETGINIIEWPLLQYCTMSAFGRDRERRNTMLQKSNFIY